GGVGGQIHRCVEHPVDQQSDTRECTGWPLSCHYRGLTRGPPSFGGGVCAVSHAQKKPRRAAGLERRAWRARFEEGVRRAGARRQGYSSRVRISASSSDRRLVKRAAAAPLITRWS